MSFEVLADANDEMKAKGPLVNLHEPMMMLAGMAIEVKLKALVVSDFDKKSALLRGDREICRVFFSHDLAALSKLAAVDLSVDEEETANALSQFVLWRGRYVVPTEKRTMDFASAERRDGSVKPATFFATLDRVRFLIEHVVREIKVRVYDEPGIQGCASAT